jgi:PncC family amidohydrolase
MTAPDIDRPFEERLHALLANETRLTVATAESCSGGGVTLRMTSVPGSSAYVLGGIVAYANEAKIALLGVPPEMLATHGAVSAECARAMAEGARRAFGADLAVATTGIAGPGGATAGKPVGLVYLAVAGPEGTPAEVERHHFPGDRAAVVAAAVEGALRLLVDRVETILPIVNRRAG